MKQKYLFSMLLGGAMLASCSVDDDFKSAQMPQKVNPSAPVFNVHFDNDDPLTRAHWIGGNSMKVGFDDNDLMSLYHGVKNSAAPEDPEEEVTEYQYESFTGWQNAIYKGSENEATGAFTFTTQALVNAGGAIMIYPADTTLWTDKSNAAPVISIKTNQPKGYRLQTPYMSEVITIGEYSGNIEKPEAGYGRQYDIAMKRVASTLALTLGVKQPEQMPTVKTAIKITGVELDAKANLFTTKVSIKAADTPAKGQVLEEGKEAHVTWTNQSTLDLGARREQVDANTGTGNVTSKLTTEDIEDGVAYFTLLPILGTMTQQINNSEVIVKTNYGFVKLTGTTDKLWKKGNDEMSINDGLKSLTNANNFWKKSTKEPFAEEEVGTYIPRELSVDLKDLNLNGLHIIDEDHLKDVAEVLKVFKLKDSKTVFYLDGDENGEFRIETPEGYQAYKEIITFADDIDDKTLELQLCKKDDEKCKLVVLKSIATDEVPEVLKFGKSTPTDEVLVQLEGEWTLTGSHTFDKVDSLIVGNGTKLQLIGTVNNKTTVKNAAENAQFVATTALVNRPEGEINVITREVILQMPTYNYGTINVGTDETGSQTTGDTNVRLRMSGLNVEGIDANNRLKLVNEIYTTKLTYESTYDETLKYVKDTEGRGKIYLKNRLATVDKTNGAICNYGYIEVIHQTLGSALLWENGTALADFAQPFLNQNAKGHAHTGDNIFGVLKVTNETDPLTLIQNKATNGGFVKVKKSGTALADGSIANYVIVEASGSTLNFGTTTADYVEFANKLLTVTVNSNASVTQGIIIPEQVVVTIPAGKDLKVSNRYLKGEIYRAGTLSAISNKPVKYVTYMGGEEDDQYNVSSPGNNQ